MHDNSPKDLAGIAASLAFIVAIAVLVIIGAILLMII
jgi:hypothetical protein